MAAPLALTGFGMGMVFVPMFDVILAGVAPHEIGSASGLLESVQQLAMSIGIAAAGTVLFDRLGAGHGAAAFVSAADHGLLVAIAFLIAAGDRGVLAAQARAAARGVGARRGAARGHRCAPASGRGSAALGCAGRRQERRLAAGGRPGRRRGPSGPRRGWMRKPIYLIGFLIHPSPSGFAHRHGAATGPGPGSAPRTPPGRSPTDRPGTTRPKRHMPGVPTPPPPKRTSRTPEAIPPKRTRTRLTERCPRPGVRPTTRAQAHLANSPRQSPPKRTPRPATTGIARTLPSVAKAAKPEPVQLTVGERTVRLSSPDRVYFSARGETKLDLARYYMSVGDGIVRALRERPCMLHRFPDGVDGEKVHQKRVPKGAPEWLETVRVHFPAL